jgi:hypothetical protein
VYEEAAEYDYEAVWIFPQNAQIVDWHFSGAVGRERVVRRGLLRPDVSRLERLQRENLLRYGSQIFINSIAQPPHGEAAAQLHCRPQAAPAPSRHTLCPAAEPQERR